VWFTNVFSQFLSSRVSGTRFAAMLSTGLQRKDMWLPEVVVRMSVDSAFVNLSSAPVARRRFLLVTLLSLPGPDAWMMDRSGLSTAVAKTRLPLENRLPLPLPECGTMATPAIWRMRAVVCRTQRNVGQASKAMARRFQDSATSFWGVPRQRARAASSIVFPRCSNVGRYCRKRYTTRRKLRNIRWRLGITLRHQPGQE
jgi:hypothetical protein